MKNGKVVQRLNSLGQPIGASVVNWQSASIPPRTTIEGKYCRIEPIDPDRHATELFEAFRADQENRIWTYLPYGPFVDAGALTEWIRRECLGPDPMFHAVIDKSRGTAAGVASFLRIMPAIGTIEVGHINYSPSLQRRQAATEAMYLLMRRVFDELGYRRYEWKCDALNARSRTAALRLGFQFEGIFRQATIYKGRNRDTAWYSIIDTDWPIVSQAFEAWLDPENFDAAQRQRRSLGNLRASG